MMALAMHHNPAVNISRENLAQDTDNQDGLDDRHPLQGTEKAEKKLVRQGSVSENFFAVKNASLILPKQTTLGEPVEGMKSMKFGGDLKTHLYAIINVVRSQDKIKLVARLESWDKERMRYLVIVSTIGRQDTEESIILGIDFTKNEHKKCTIGLTIPIWSDMNIQLDGDGGFKVSGRDSTYTFKPISVQALWSAIQAVHRCIDVAQLHNYYFGSLYLTWTCYYESHLNSCRLFCNEWQYHDQIWSRRPNYYSNPDPARETTEMKIRGKLKEVMMKMDLDNCNSRDVRQALEKVVDLDLKQYKEYIDTEMLTILGQMDTASEILDFLYLGSEWNASNSDELKQNGITHILNITMEIDNFFPDDFTYKNIRCYDEETTDLLPVWNDTWKFIKQARRSNGRCLVHCKMGISRSAATVAAFIMKTNHWPMEKALSFVREKRPIVFPNSGFMLQLREYEGILNASAQRHNQLFRSYSESNLQVEQSPTADAEDESSSRSPSQPQIDFNRQLLDITSLTYRPSHKRCKSWSPGDTKLYDPDDITAADHQEEASSLNTAPLSEPQDVFTSHRSSSEIRPSQDKESAAYKKKRWKRRHTERVITLPVFDLDAKPQSEDSVFVNPGVKIQSITDNSLLTGLRAAWKSSQVATKPDDDCKDSLAVMEPPSHSSLASPMNSPSFKCTRNVSVSALKSHFGNESILQIELSNDEPMIVQAEQTDTVAPLSFSTKSLSSSDHIPESEDVSQEPKRVPTLLGRSMSDSQVCHVKSLVSDIELRYGEGKNSTRDRNAFDVSRTAALPLESSIEMLEKLAVPPEVAVIEKELSANSNTNNNNNNNNGQNLLPLEPPMDNICADSISSNSFDQPKPNVEPALEPVDPPTLSKTRSLTQNELQIIREVGKTFLGEMVLPVPDEDTSFTSYASEVTQENAESSPKHSSDKKKCGIVRRMARIIENKIKRQSLEMQESQQQMSAHPDKQTNLALVDTPTNEHRIAAVLALPGSSQALGVYEPDHVIVREVTGAVTQRHPNVEVLQTNTSQAANQHFTTNNLGTASSRQQYSGPSSNRSSDLFSLIGPTPYDPTRTLSAVTRVEFKGRQSVRRSQSERSFTVRARSHLSRYRGKRSPAVSRLADGSGGYATYQRNVEVKRMVRMMEEGPIAARDLPIKDAAKIDANRDDHSSHFTERVAGNKIEDDLSSCAKSRWLRRDNYLYQTI